jgi:hypothetical protein
MQDAVFDQPYRFIPPYRGNGWPNLIQSLQLYRPYLRRNEGAVEFRVTHAERISSSLRAGHGILITPNHPQLGDPLVIGQLTRLLPSHVYVMASWHLFRQSWLTGFCVHRMQRLNRLELASQLSMNLRKTS